MIAGEGQPPAVHALAHLMNAKLGNVGKTVFYTDPVEANPVDQLASLQDLVKDLDAGAVELLLILGGNPAFNAPVELGMRDRFKKAQAARAPRPLRRRDLRSLPVASARNALPGNLGRCARFRRHRHHPAAADRSRYTTAARRIAIAADAHGAGRDAAPTKSSRATGRRSTQGADFEAWWRARGARWRGAGHRAADEDATVRGDAARARRCQRQAGSSGKLEVIFRPDPAIYDGRFANNGWLQELPKPMTKLTWDNAAFIEPGDGAARLGVENRAIWSKLTYQGRTLNAPVFVQPGHADGAVTLHLGYGRTRAGRAGTGMGFNPYGLRTGKALWQDVGLEMREDRRQL